MDIKLKTSEMLLQKLSFGSGDARLNAIAEIRLFSKWDDDNRRCLAQAGAIAPLLSLLEDPNTDVRVQEIAAAALVNMSINTQVKLLLVREPEAVDTVLRITGDGGNKELRAVAAGLLYSLIADDEARKIVCSNDNLWETVIGLLRDGSGKCKAEALKSLFVLAKDELGREKLVKEEFQLVGLLISLLTTGMVKLTEDCLAVVGLLAKSAAGTKAIMAVTSALPILIYLLHSGSPRAQENAASVLLSMCEQDEEAKDVMPKQNLIPALNSLSKGGSDRGKAKAESLLKILGFDPVSSLSIDPNLYAGKDDSDSSLSPGMREINTVPLIPRYQLVGSSPPRHQLQHIPHSSVSPSAKPSSAPLIPNATLPKNNKYISLARNLFNHKSKKKT